VSPNNNPRAFEVTRRSVLALVWPIMLASITVPFMGITDTAAIGQLGDAALLGGLAIGAVIIDLIFTGLNFLRSGTVG
jgi:MATE family multidrug resistance protein